MGEETFSEKLRINIDGMTCKSCERRIQAVLSKLTGIINVEVSLISCSAEVEFDQHLTTRNEIFLTITKLGYTITGDSKNSAPVPVSGKCNPGSGTTTFEKSVNNTISENVTILVSGMHCKSCEVRIESEFMTRKGVIKANANFKRETLSLEYENGFSLSNQQIVDILKSLGYSVGQGKSGFSLFSKDPVDYRDLAIAFVLLLGLYGILQLSGLGNLAPSTSSKSFSLPIILLIGLTAGFSTCMALVGGLVLGISAKLSEARPDATPAEKFRPHLFFCSGRVLSYIILGGVLGLVGSVFQFSSFSLGILTIIIGVVMLIMGIQLLNIFPWANHLRLTLPKSISRKFSSPSGKKYSHGNAMLLGAFTFFLPCGFTQAMQVYAIGTGNFIDGALTMGAFAIGTIPGLLGIGGLTAVVKGAFARGFFKFAGLVVVFFAVFNISNGMGLSGLSLPLTNKMGTTLNDPNVTIENGVQVVRMKEVENGYVPKTISIRSDLPVKWIIDAEAPLSCAASFVVPKLNIQKTLTAGENIINFTPEKPGVIKFSCSMGMYTGAIYIQSPEENISTEVSEEDVEVEDEGTSEPEKEFSIAVLSDTVQHVKSVINDYSYQPILIQKGIPVKWTIYADSAVLNACNNKIKIPGLNIESQLKPGETMIQFTASEIGDIEFTCWMNMIKSTIRVTDTLTLPKTDSTLKQSAITPLVNMAMGGCCRQGIKACNKK